MISIGFRVTPNKIYYCIAKKVNDTNIEIISTSSIIVPKALDEPHQLSFIRNNLSTILLQYKVTNAGIKLIEGNARKNNISFVRLYLEGVILELFANSLIEKYVLGITSNIASILKLEKKPIKDMLTDLEVESSDYSDEEKESIVVAIASLNI